jgi:hypothetical protein
MSAMEETGALARTTSRPVSMLGDPSQLNLLESYIASLLPEQGSKGRVFCNWPKVRPSREATL